MIELLCRNRVKDYNAWREIFDAQIKVHTDTGLHLSNLWQDVGDPNNIFFLFRVDDIEKARAVLTLHGQS